MGNGLPGQWSAFNIDVEKKNCSHLRVAACRFLQITLKCVFVILTGLIFKTKV